MAIEKVREYFAGCGMADRILEFDSSSATVELAAQALSCEPRRIAKSLSFMLGEEPILVVTAGDAKVDNAKYKAKFGKKAKMLTPDEVVQFIGHAIGGSMPVRSELWRDCIPRRIAQEVQHRVPRLRKQQQRD